jgi:CheY-like chemotaxis protein
LIADDERTNHLLVRGFLRGSPVTLWEANDGLQAVELWKSKKPSAILMDLRMPGLSGLEAARRIRALDPRGSTRLLAMSATKPSEIELAEGRPLWSGYLEKPFSKQDLLKFLSKHLTIVDDSAKSS